MVELCLHILREYTYGALHQQLQNKHPRVPRLNLSVSPSERSVAETSVLQSMQHTASNNKVGGGGGFTINDMLAK